jgi:hypothetical protein
MARKPDGKAAMMLSIRLLRAGKTVEDALRENHGLDERPAEGARLFALFSRRVAVMITSSRVLTVRRGLLGGFKMSDIQWKDLLDVTLEQNVIGPLCGSNLKFSHLNRTLPPLAVDGVPADAASSIYSKAQLEEQAWEEMRRVRGMEEIRAAAGGVVVHAGASGGAAEGQGNRLTDQIGQAKALLDSGAISDAEFQEMKAKILAG